MDINITEAFRQEDISKTDFFDFVVSPDLTESQLQLAKQMRSVNVFLEQDVQSPPETSTSSKEQNNNLLSSDGTPPLAGYDQFWSADNKDSTRLESAILEDLSRYCWNQPQDSLPSLGSGSNTDGQIYTLTVLNGTATEPWPGRKEEAPAPLDLESILGGLPGFAVKTESFSYEDSGFADNKDDLNEFQNNNNDWRLADHNSSADSLLRSALQGKGYGKPKPDEELRRALTTPSDTVLFPIIPVTTDQDSLGFVDATLPLFDEEHQSTPVDDMFLSQLDVVTYPEDYEKLKRIATEVQQFCTETYTPAEVTSSVAKPAVKKYRKSNAGGKPTNTATTGTTASTCTGGARKERSLHYCSICSKGFKDKYSVNVHIRTHTGEKPFACSLCGKSFRQKAHLAKHYQTHLAQKNATAGNAAKPSKR